MPNERIGCSGATAWRRLRDWTEAGVWPRLHEALPGGPAQGGTSGHGRRGDRRLPCPSPQRGSHRAFAGRPRPPGQQTPSDHRAAWSALVVSLTGGNRHDVTQLVPLLDAIPHIRGVPRRPRHRPRRLFADRGYDYDKYRRLVRDRGITHKIARKGTALRMVPPVQTPADPLRNTRRSPPRSTPTRLQKCTLASDVVTGSPNGSHIRCSAR